MKTILALIASPRKKGNCELAVKELVKHIPEPHKLKLLRLSDFKIKPCKACFKCLFGKMNCSINDDLIKIIKAMIETDVIILSVPTYFLGANSELKVLLDRGLAFYKYAEQIWGKPAIGIGVAGLEGKEGTTALEIRRFLKVLLADIKGIEILIGSLPGEVLLNSNNNEKIQNLGKILSEKSIPNNEQKCPLCGNDTFQFFPNNHVKCIVCSNFGEMVLEEGKPVFKIEKDKHGIFLTPEDAEDHLKWLQSMKQRYLEKRKEMKEVRNSFHGDWDWIKPENH
ncbi:MAG TPA: flavodoxin family protein [Candidatus Cloacimonetes bacterium]|nr:flavodoxin family protein [Candidatus Cloacimonadota bacterium]